MDATKHFDRFDGDVTWHVALHMGFAVALIVVFNTFFLKILSRTFQKLRSISALGSLQRMVLVKVTR